MAGWLGKAASVVMVFIATWGATILYWRNSGTVPTGMQMLAYLGLLPVGLSGAGFMLRNAARRGADVALQKAGEDRSGPAPAERESVAGAPSGVPAVALLAGRLRLVLWRGMGRAEVVPDVDEAAVLKVLSAR
ncbi:hypothetical protein G6F57_018202 [Rhizopus arrhizus]|nr:hypothetical protein G6F57_018202 [Rhizopus arrhizus]